MRRMPTASLNDWYGKPLLNGLIPECLWRRPFGLRHSCHRSTTGCVRGRMPPGKARSLSSIDGIELDMVNGMGIRGTAAKRGLAFVALGLGVLLSGCMQQTVELASDSNLT